MLRSVKEMMDYTLEAKDGEIGRCRDFLFDDQHWTVRYMVADTRKWLPSRKVLISPISLNEPEWVDRLFPVDLTREEVRNSPSLDEDAPVSRRHEIEYFKHYGWSYYWEGPEVWGAYPIPVVPVEPPRATPPSYAVQETDPESTHLRSAKEVTGYHIHATDGDIGHVDDFIMEEGVWVIRYMIVDTRNWLPGRKVLVSPGWIESINWDENRVHVNLTRKAIKEGPEYDPSMPVNREYEVRLYDFYGRPKYWE
jgi:hypothetical protein